MSDVLDEAQAVVQCKTCPWYKHCVLPIRFTDEDLKRQLESSLPGFASAEPPPFGVQQLLSSLVTAAENSLLEGCPVFINRLRSSPRLAERIKRLMQDWSDQ